MKKNYKIFAIGSDVWGISEYLKEGGGTQHFAIFPAKVKSFDVSYDKKTNSEEQTYWLATPDGDEWGDTIIADHVYETFEEACNYLKKIWIKHANTF